MQAGVLDATEREKRPPAGTCSTKIIDTHQLSADQIRTGTYGAYTLISRGVKQAKVARRRPSPSRTMPREEMAS